MVIQSARRAARGLLEKKSRAVVLKSLGLTILLFFGVWFGLDLLLRSFIIPLVDGWTWLITVLLWLTGVGLVIGAGFLLAPVTAIFAGIFLDEVAEQVERDDYPEDPVGSPVPLVTGIIAASKFAVLVLTANVIALLLVWLAGFGILVFYLVNGYLLGREYFQFAAMRFGSEGNASTLRKRYSFEVFLGGVIIAAFMSVPFLNLLTPVFAAKLMVHMHKAAALNFQQQG